MPKVQVVVRIIEGKQVFERMREWDVLNVAEMGGTPSVGDEAQQAAYEVADEYLENVNVQELERQRVGEDDEDD